MLIEAAAAVTRATHEASIVEKRDLANSGSFGALHNLLILVNRWAA